MPRPARVAREAPSNSLVAAGARMGGPGVAPAVSIYNYGETWQDAAWHFYDTVGELRYAATYFSKVLSRARLYAATREGKDFTEQKAGDVFDAVSEFFHGPEGQSQALAAIGLHLFVVGECYIVGREPRADRGENGNEKIWEIISKTEIKVVGGVWSIETGDTRPKIVLDKNEDVIRIWYPHPKSPTKADSPVRAVLGPLAEVERLSQHIMAQIVSRLTGAGLLLLPQGMTFPSPPANSPMPADATDADKVMAVLFEAMMTAVQNPGDASAVAPIVMLVPDEFIDKANLLKFWTDLDEKSIEMRSAAIRRVAIGLDLPVEVLMGTADVNHWGSWQIAEESIKAHAEPALELIVSALSAQYVVPNSVPNGAMRYDTSQLRLRPNRSQEAIELYDRGELDAEALRRETGFAEDDKPDETEMKAWYLKKIAGNSSATPEMMAEALRLLGVDVGSGFTEGDTVNESRPDPSLRDHPTQEIPEDPGLAAAVEIGYVRAAEGVALRALERAGNRLRSNTGQRPSCTATEVHTFVPAKQADLDRLLDGAWDHIPQVLRGIPYDQQQAIQAGLDSYCRAVILGQKPHDIELLQRHLMLSSARNPV